MEKLSAILVAGVCGLSASGCYSSKIGCASSYSSASSNSSDYHYYQWNSSTIDIFHLIEGEYLSIKLIQVIQIVHRVYFG